MLTILSTVQSQEDNSKLESRQLKLSSITVKPSTFLQQLYFYNRYRPYNQFFNPNSPFYKGDKKFGYFDGRLAAQGKGVATHPQGATSFVGPQVHGLGK